MASQQVERSCSMLMHFDKPLQASEIKEALEGNDNDAKVNAMQKAIMMLLNGEQLPELFFTIVRYVLPSEDHTVQKLLLLYLETIEKTDSAGKLLPAMILICQNLRNNLQHPNEYIRGATLRFLCRIREEEILEPLVPSILANLEHRHSFVRRNAVLAINEMYKLPKGELLMPDAPELVENFLSQEQDLSARRNAFMMLANHDTDRAKNYLLTQVDSVASWGDVLQLAALDLVRKVCRSNPAEKGRYIKIILSLLQSKSTGVVYECAVTLTSLSQAPTAIKAASNCYCQLLVSQSDNNVKLIVLDRLQELKEAHSETMQDMVMDILRALSSPNMDIRRKTLDISMDLVNGRNIDEVVLVLKKEIMKTQSREVDKAADYRQLLVAAVHTCALKFPDVAAHVVTLLMDFVGDTSTASALDVIFFLREIMETNTKLRAEILENLRDAFSQIRSARVAACALWIMGEYSESTTDIADAMDTVKSALGPIPFFKEDEDKDDDDEEDKDKTPKTPGVGAPTAAAAVRPAVLADGTYATQAALVEASVTGQGAASSNLRSMLLAGEFFLGSVIAATMTKLMMRLSTLDDDPAGFNRKSAEVMATIVAMLRFGEAGSPATPMDADAAARMAGCIRVLAAPADDMRDVWLHECRAKYAAMVAEKRSLEAAELEAEKDKVAAQPDDLVDFTALLARRGLSKLELEDEVSTDLGKATGYGNEDGKSGRQLSRVLQLTGLSDPVYAEAYVAVHQYDIVLDVTVVNRTPDTLQALCLELATMGDLKLVERPHNYTLAPGDSKLIRANIKVSSTETGVIFGNIVYESTGAMERAVVVLNDIHIDIMDYISPASCSDALFRSMWAEFEWENKVAINTAITDVDEFLAHIVAATNMRCLTPPSALSGDCGYLAANLYAKSVFGEDALVNVSVEKQADSKLSGYIRIRSKTQGIALSLGDKITLKQKGP